MAALPFAAAQVSTARKSPDLQTSLPTTEARSADRFWVAGRYDGNRVIVYFDAVRFGAPIAADVARPIAEPVATGFFAPVSLPESYVAGFENAPGAEHFRLGDEYDVLLPHGMAEKIRLTALVGFESDEDAGNDSYIGALGTIEGNSYVLSDQNYYVVRHHRQEKPVKPQVQVEKSLAAATLIADPVSFETETRIAELMTAYMKVEATPQEQAAATRGKLYLQIQPFHTSGGALHYYASVAWKNGKEDSFHPPYAVGAWIVVEPTLHIVAVEGRTTGYGDFGLPKLLNVIDLGDGQTGAIFDVQGDDSNEITLVEYRDGANLKQMHEYQTIGVGE
ncbi:MAG TPA: hypothetical protein VJS43_08815 [Candidatus Acidoferrales bacterium]|nr:hypothetical protein [Candidatus Acidoferrales bacterium]